MTMVTKILIGLFVIILLFTGGCALSVIGFNNSSVAQEESIKAQYKQNQNNYDNYFKKLKETAQVPDMYASDLKKVYDGVVSGRYGDKGSQAIFQAIAEHNPNFDASLYKQIQQIIESGRNSFEADQKTLLDKKRVYETNLRQFPTSIYASMLGFPKIDLAQYDIVTSTQTEEIFKTKKSEVINLKN